MSKLNERFSQEYWELILMKNNIDTDQFYSEHGFKRSQTYFIPHVTGTNTIRVRLSHYETMKVSSEIMIRINQITNDRYDLMSDLLTIIYDGFSKKIDHPNNPDYKNEFNQNPYLDYLEYFEIQGERIHRLNLLCENKGLTARRVLENLITLDRTIKERHASVNAQRIITNRIKMIIDESENSTEFHFELNRIFLRTILQISF